VSRRFRGRTRILPSAQKAETGKAVAADVLPWIYMALYIYIRLYISET